MALPIIQHPIFTLKLPSSGQTVKYRPFLVKEEKILLLAQTAGTPNDFIRAVVQVIANCVLDDIDTEQFTSFDTEYFFLKLRAASISNEQNIRYWDNDLEDYTDVTIDFDNLEVTKSDKSNIIDINETVKLELRYPRYNDLLEMADDTTVENSTEVLSSCIKTIYDGEEPIDPKDSSTEELNTFIDSIPSSAFKVIQEYFADMPKITMKQQYEVKVNNKKKKKTAILTGINDFF